MLNFPKKRKGRKGGRKEEGKEKEEKREERCGKGSNTNNEQ
jgi:hypothetical protein